MSVETSVVALSAPAVKNRRAAERFPANVAVSLTRMDGVLCWTGSMTNVSETGAQLVISRSHEVPERFLMHENLQDNVFECKTAWRSSQRLGFRVVDTCGMVAWRRLVHAIRDERKLKSLMSRKQLPSL